MSHLDDTRTSKCQTASFPDGGEEELLIQPLEGNLYRLEETPMLAEASYHDIIEAEILSDGKLRFLCVATPSNLKTVSCNLPNPQCESHELSAVLDRVMAIGGNWERVFGGVLLLHLPPAEEAFILEQLRAALSDPRT